MNAHQAPTAPTAPKERERPHRAPSTARALVAGGSLGVLVGLILGMSVNPIAASVVGSVMALLMGYGAVRPSLEKPAEAAPPAAPAPIPDPLVGFALAAVAALLAGVYLRTHNVLSPTPREITDRWRAAGMSPREALDIARATFGLPPGPAGAPALAANTPPAPPVRHIDSILTGGASAQCDELKQKLNLRVSMDALAQAFKTAGPDWERRFQDVQGRPIPEDEKRQALDQLVELACKGEGP